MPAPASSPEPQPDEPFFLGVIDLFVKVAAGYFAVFGVALAVDFVRGDRLTFGSWIGFALQSAAAFLAATIVVRRALPGWQPAVIIGLVLAIGTLAGGFFPDAIGYQRRAPEPFWRTISALVPAAIAVYLVLRFAPDKRRL